MKKIDFMNSLKSRLAEYGVTDSREILLDFEQHFEDGIAAGETEDMVCKKLGDPNEIAKQYIPDMEIPAMNTNNATGSGAAFGAAPGGFATNSYSVPPQAAQNQGFQPDAGKIIAMLAIDLLLLSWAVPSLISLVVGLYGCTIGFGAGGIASFIGGILMNFIDTSTWLFTTFSPLSTTLFGVMIMAGCSLLVIASIAATKGVINLIKLIINWHSETFVGRRILSENKTGEAF